MKLLAIGTHVKPGAATLIMGGAAMLKGGHERLKIWFRKHVNYRGPRKQSDYRAVKKAQRLIYFGGMVDGRMTGCPLLERGGK